MNNELYHYGVKGMKWGVRKERKWAAHPVQPSSRRSSDLALMYLMTGSKRIGSALDKSNAKDKERWEKAKAAHPDLAPLREARSKKLTDNDKNHIKAMNKFDKIIETESVAFRKAQAEGRPYDESKLETALTNRYRLSGDSYLRMQGRVMDMSIADIERVNRGEGKDTYERAMIWLEKNAR